MIATKNQLKLKRRLIILDAKMKRCYPVSNALFNNICFVAKTLIGHFVVADIGNKQPIHTCRITRERKIVSPKHSTILSLDYANGSAIRRSRILLPSNTKNLSNLIDLILSNLRVLLNRILVGVRDIHISKYDINRLTVVGRNILCSSIRVVRIQF